MKEFFILIFPVDGVIEGTPMSIKTSDGLYYINSADEDEVKSCYDYIVK